MRQHEDELASLGIDVVIVTFQVGPMAAAYVREAGLTWPLLVDEKLELYSAYGMDRGGWRDIWGPSSWWIYAKLLLRGRRIRRPSGDVNQLGGDVLIDPRATVRLHHVGAGPADRPSIAALLDTVHRDSASTV